MRLIDMPSARFICSSPCGPDGRQKRTDGEQRLNGQISTRLSNYKYYNFGNQAGFSLPSSLQRAWGLAKTASVINYSSTGQPT
jgi:hypothetical protein